MAWLSRKVLHLHWKTKLLAFLGRDVPITMAVNLLLHGLGFASGILLARALQPAGRGEFAAATLWPNLLISLGSLGLPQAVTYYAGRRRAALGPVVGTTLALGLALSLLLLPIGWFLFPMALHAQRPEVLAAARLNLAFIPLAMGLGLQTFILQGAGRLRLWNGLRLAQRLLYAAGLTVLALSGRATVLAAVWVLSLTTALGGPFAFGLIRRELDSTIGFERELAGKLVSYGLKNNLSGIAWMVNARLDQTLMTLFIAPQQLGLYAVAVALAQGLQPISAAFANVAFPRVTHTENLSDARRVIRRAFQANAVVSLGLALPLALVAPQVVVWLFGPSYAGAGWPARILIVGGVFFGANYVLSDSLRGLNAPLGPALAEWIGLVVTGVGLYLLLPRFGILGAALTSLLSYLAVLLVLLWVLWRRFGLAPWALARVSPEETARLGRALGVLRGRFAALWHAAD